MKLKSIVRLVHEAELDAFKKGERITWNDVILSRQTHIPELPTQIDQLSEAVAKQAGYISVIRALMTIFKS